MVFDPLARPRNHRPMDRNGICAHCQQPFFKQYRDTKTCSDACLKSLRRTQALSNVNFTKGPRRGI